MPTITPIKTGNYATGVKVQTQFDMETRDKLFEITGPKTLEWKYKVTSAKLQEHGADIVDEHVQKVKKHLEQNWRGKFKTDVKKTVLKDGDMKKIEDFFKNKPESARKQLKAQVEKAASDKAERIIKEEFETFMAGVSDKCLREMGTKASKLKKATKTVAIGGAALGVSAVGITVSIASMGTAAIPALTATGAALAILAAGGTAFKTLKNAQKEFRDQQEKLSKSKGAALKAVEAALDDAKKLKTKYDQMVLRQNNMGTKIEDLDRKVAGLRQVRIDEPKASKLAKEAEKISEELKKDQEKLERLTSKDPRYMVTALEAVLKRIEEDVDIDEDIAAHGRLDNALGAAARAGALAGGISSLSN